MLTLLMTSSLFCDLDILNGEGNKGGVFWTVPLGVYKNKKTVAHEAD